MPKTALITGASGGIGRELAQLHAERGNDLIVVARSEDELSQLKTELEQKYKVRVEVIVKDLTTNEAPSEVFARVEELGITVDYLINNAGFGGHGLFHEQDWQKEASMIRLNILALTELTHLFLPGMVKRKTGKILNVASTAAFLPGPLQAVYYATKAFVLSFSQAIAEEVADANITVTALCPGPVETGFAKAANAEDVEAFQNAASPRAVAELGYSAMLDGKLVVINDWKLSLLLNWFTPLMPRRMLLKLSRRFMEKN